MLKEDPLISRLLQIPVHHHSDIYSPILPLEEGHRIQAFSRKDIAAAITHGAPMLPHIPRYIKHC